MEYTVLTEQINELTGWWAPDRHEVIQIDQIVSEEQTRCFKSSCYVPNK